MVGRQCRIKGIKGVLGKGQVIAVRADGLVEVLTLLGEELLVPADQVVVK